MSRSRNISLDVHLNLNVRGLRPSATLAIQERSAQLAREGRDVVRLGLGQSPFPVPELVVEALRRNAHQKDYLPVRGLQALREAVAGFHSRVDGVERSGDDVLVGPGSKELMFILQLVYYGDLVIATPSWVSYAPQAHIVGRPIHWVPTRAQDDWRLTPEALDRLCHDDPERPRIVILNYPSNPTGHSYTVDELRALAAVARTHKVILLSDEIYGQIHHRGQHVSVARFYPEGTIVSSGLSKWCGAGGWRLGTFTFPPGLRWLLEAMAVVASETFTSTSAPIQHASVEAFAGGEAIDRYLRASRRVLRALGRHCWHRLVKGGAAVVEPQGAFYLFPDLGPHRDALARRGVVDSRTLCEQLLADTGVATLPGIEFGRPADELTLRLAYVDFDGARALGAAEQVPSGHELDLEFLTQRCPRVVQAIDAMVAWAAG